MLEKSFSDRFHHPILKSELYFTWKTMATGSLPDCLNLSMDNIFPSEQTTLPT